MPPTDVVQEFHSPQDFPKVRQKLEQNVLESLKTRFPFENDRYRIELEDPHFDGPEHFSLKDQKNAILQRRSLTRPVKGTWRMFDKGTGEQVDSYKTTVVDVPWMTPRGTFIQGGSEWTVARQARLRPGVYARQKESGELEGHINVTSGPPSFRVFLEPETGLFRLQVGQAKLKMLPVLRAMGIKDRDLQDQWGPALFAANQQAGDDAGIVQKLWHRVANTRARKATNSPTPQNIIEAFAEAKLDPTVTTKTLGQPYDHVSPEVLVATTRKLLNVANGSAEMDDRDSMEFQETHGPEHLLGERIQKDAGRIMSRNLWKATLNKSLRNMTPGALTAQIESLLYRSGLGQPLEEISPLDALDQNLRITRMGEGGISSGDAVPVDCYDDQTEVFTLGGWKLWRDVCDHDKFACLDDDDHMHFSHAIKLIRAPYSGKMYGVTSRTLDMLVTPNHRHWIRKERGGGATRRLGLAPWQFEYASETHRKPRAFKIRSCGWAGDVVSDTYTLPAVEGSRKTYTFRLTDFAALIGWYVSEGSIDSYALAHRSKYHITISQSAVANPDKTDEIGALLTRMGIQHSYQGCSHVFVSKQIGVYLKSICGYRSADKRLPSEAFSWPMEARRALFEAMVKGDGSTQACGHIVYCTTSRQLRDDLVRLACSMGLPAVNNKDDTRGNYPTRYICGVLSSHTQAVGSASLYDNYYIKDYCGMIYCAQVPGERLLVRRNGRVPVWSGNSRNVQPSHFLFIDPIRTPESTGVGVDLRLAGDTMVGDDGQLSTKVVDIGTGKTVQKSPAELSTAVVAFPGEMERARKLGLQSVRAMAQGKLGYHPIEEVQYSAPRPSSMFTLGSNLVPGVQGIKGGRLLMGAKFLNQALPLEEREAPLVRAGDGAGSSFVENLGTKMGAVKAQEPGVVESVTPDGIVVRQQDGQAREYELYNNFPLNRKTQQNSFPKVKPGDRVRPNQLLASSNYTDDQGVFAPGRNLRTAYMPYPGNYEDAIVISESAAKKMRSVHMYTEKADTDDFTEVNGKRFISMFPGKYDRQQLEKLDTDGVVKTGQVVQPGDPLFLMVQQRTSKGAGQLYRGGAGQFKDAATTWQHDTPGIVTDVWRDDEGVKVAVKTVEAMQVGSKLAGTFGDKGVVGAIIPDDRMPSTADGPLDVILNPLGVISRGNPSQVYETVLGKIARKTGKPYRLDSFGQEDMAEFVEQEMKRNGVSDVEDVTDPETGRKLPGVIVGERYLLALHHTAASKESSRGLGSHTAEGVPTKSFGDEPENPKRIGLGEMQALLSHGATENIRDIKMLRGQANNQFWRDMTSGGTPATPDMPPAYRKFLSSMQAAGITFKRDGNRLHLTAMTDRDVDALSSGEITEPQTVRWMQDHGKGAYGEKSLEPVAGGLFDRAITGGHGGNRWSTIKLKESVPSPVMEDPIRRLLNLTQKQYESVISGAQEIPGHGTGGAGIQHALQAIKVQPTIELLKSQYRAANTGTARHNILRKLKFLDGMAKGGVEPKDLILTKVPVLPPIFRPISANSKFEMVAGPNFLYMDLMNADKAAHELAQVAEGEPVQQARLARYNALKAVTGLGDPIKPERVQRNVRGVLATLLGSSPKFGTFQRNLLSTTVDLSGRAAIIPNPELSMDQMGIPEDTAWKLYAPFVVRRMVKTMGREHRADAIKAVVNRDPTATRALMAELAERPILASRAPVLHRFGIMGFRPMLVKGKSLQLSPPITPGFGADFDGDQNIGCVIVKLNACASKLIALRYGDQFMEARRMGTKFRMQLPVKAGRDTFIINLEDMPHEDEPLAVKQGEKGQIDFHAALPGMQVLAYDEKSHAIRWADLAGWSKHYAREIVTVELASGRQIITDDDPRAVYGVAAGTLEIKRFTPSEALSQHVMVPRAIRFDAVEELNAVETGYVRDSFHAHGMPDSVALNADSGYFFGAMCGDGWVTHTNGITKGVAIAGVCDEVMNRFEACVASVTGRFIKRGDIDSKHSYGKSRKVTYSSKSLAEFTEPYIGCGADNKHLPAFFLTAPLSFRKGLLAGLIDTDGTVCVSHAKGKKPQVMAAYQSNSIRLVQEVQLLCLSLGIRTRICPSKTPAGKACWILSISNLDVHKIEGIHHPAKIEAARQAPTKLATVAMRLDLLPIDRDLATMFKKWLGAPRGKVPPLWHAAWSASRTGYMTRDSARRIVSMFVNRLKEHPAGLAWQAIVEDVSVTWDMVESVTPTGIREDGYDLTVPGFETFMSVDGVIMSNTMNFHPVVSDRAIRETYEKLLPSRSLRSPATMEALHGPRQEYLQGLYGASTARRPSGKVFGKFRDNQEVVRAFMRGDLDLGDSVQVDDGK